ncbi:MAG: ABC transporter substrate-binding protein [Vicinamibacteria bacterium]|nr:ABC transporter substrate-binding protein [Vicinamibacteria bacterium]
MATETRSKTFRVGYLTPARNLDPRTSWDVESSFVIRHVFETPFGNPYGSTDVEPHLFSGPLQARDGGSKVYEARVRPGIRFSDGSELTAQDVVNSLRTAPPIQDEAAVSVEGDRVVFALRRPNARLDLALSHYQCSVFKQDGKNLIGTGPYSIAESTPAHVKLRRNPHYRRPVAIEEVRFDTYEPDAQGRASRLIAALESGEVDLSLSLGRDDIDQVKGVRKSLLPGVSLAMLYLNCESPRLRDPRVRTAIARAIDRLPLAATSYANPLAFAASSLTPRPLGAADVDCTYDVEAALALLAQPGVHKPDVLTLRLPWGPRPYMPYPQRVGDLLAAQIGKLGIRVEFKPMASSSDFMKTSVEGSYDMTLAGWIADTMDPCDFMESNLASNRVPQSDNLAVSSNLGRLRSAEMDAAIDAFRGDRRAENLQAITRIADREVPLVPLMYGPASSVRSYRVTNFKPTSLWYVPIEELDVTD